MRHRTAVRHSSSIAGGGGGESRRIGNVKRKNAIEGATMSIMIQHHEDVRFSAHYGGHQVTSDLPESHGGQDRGMSPPQLFIAALGACAGVYVADYCESEGIPFQSMRLELDWNYKERPRRIAGVRVCIELPSGALTPDHEWGIQDSVQRCLLHNTLAHQQDFTVEVVSADNATAFSGGTRGSCSTGVCCRARV
jgi:uncharacterized OsmC-like protein